MTLDLKNTKTDFADSNCFPILLDHREKLESLYRKLNIGIVAAERHVLRWIDIKMANKNLQTIVYCRDNTFLGDCELFFSDDIVKFDDLEVLKDFRNSRIGDALLKSAISIAKSKNMDTLYLIADKGDWVVDYYCRRGFKKFTEYQSCTLYS